MRADLQEKIHVRQQKIVEVQSSAKAWMVNLLKYFTFTQKSKFYLPLHVDGELDGLGPQSTFGVSDVNRVDPVQLKSIGATC